MRLYSFILLALPLLAQPAAKTGLGLSGIPVRGPSILADSDSRTYYLYTGADGGAVVCYTSKDLASWEGPVSVFVVPAGSWANPAEGARDPEVHAYRGRYYLFATLSNRDKVIKKPPESWRVNSMQGVQLFVSESPQGPFAAAPGSANQPYTPEDFVALDGTLFVDGDLAYLVYVHDWTQVVDASIEAIHLKADLTAPAGEALHLSKASDAPWLRQQTTTSREPRYYPAGGPFLYRTRNGTLLMTWTSYWRGKAAVVLARSLTGTVRGPWRQSGMLLAGGSASGTIFRSFDGRLMLLVHQPGQDGAARARLVELEDTGDTLRIKPAAAK
jgi:hypothetical protein